MGGGGGFRIPVLYTFLMKLLLAGHQRYAILPERAGDVYVTSKTNVKCPTPIIFINLGDTQTHFPFLDYTHTKFYPTPTDHNEIKMPFIENLINSS